MQLFALDELGQLVRADNAQKKIPYHCPECGDEVRQRSGPTIQPHFFHRQSNPCRHEAKSLEHMNVQLRLYSELKGSILERRFEEIGRVADLCSESHKLIIEVQCSFISLEELKKRTSDYESLGYQVLWILHCNRYYQEIAQPIERFLADKPHYFTTIDCEGNGLIFDQISEIRGDERTVCSPPYPLSFTSWPLKDLGKKRPTKNPSFIKRRVRGFFQTAFIMLLEHCCDTNSTE